jgi:hypothetical protein
MYPFRFRAAAERRLRLNAIFFSHFLISRAPQKIKIREEENGVSAFCPVGQGETRVQYPFCSLLSLFKMLFVRLLGLLASCEYFLCKFFFLVRILALKKMQNHVV